MADDTHSLPAARLNRTPAPSASKKFEPKRYFLGAWQLLKQDLLLFGWKLLADFLRSAVSLGTLLVVVAVVVIRFGVALDSAPGPLAGVEVFLGDILTPNFLVGAAGILFLAWLASLLLESLALSGIWTALARGARGEPIVPVKTFLAGLTTRFPAVLGLRVTTLAAQSAVVLLGAAIAIALLDSTTGSGALADSSKWLRAFVWATPLTLFALLAALVRLTMEFAAPPLIMERRPLGEAILVAANLVARRFADVYRLVIWAAGLMLVPLFFYWGVVMIGNLSIVVPELSLVATVLRFVGDIVLFVSLGAIALLFYGAVFLYYSHKMGMIDEIPDAKDSSEEPDRRRSRALGRPAFNAKPPSGQRVEFDRDTTLDDLLPDEYPNIVDLEDVLGEGFADRPDADAPAPAKAAEPDEEPIADEPTPDTTSEPDEQPDSDAVSGDDIFASDNDDSNERDDT